MSGLFLWLGGADHASLAHCPSDRTRLTALGGAVLTTALLAAAAGTVATHTWLHAPLLAALCAGGFWGVSIMNLDRWLLLTIRRQSTPPRTIALALPRLILALVVGLVISQPLLLGIFHDEVAARALQDRQAQLARAREKLTGQYQRIQSLSREQSHLQASATASPVSNLLASSKDYEALSAQLTAEQGRLQSDQQQAICELDGTCGTRHAGAGPSYRAKSQRTGSLAAQVAATEGRMRALEGTLLREADARGRQTQAFAHSQLSVVDGELATLRKEYNEGDAALGERYRTPIGLLDRVQALGELTSEHADMRDIALLLTIFVLLVDGVPVLFKTLTLLGERSLYEQIQKDREERRFRRYTFNQEQDDVAAQIAASVVVEEAQASAKLNHEVVQERAQQTARVEREVTDLLIRDFRERVVREVPELVDSYVARRARMVEAIRTYAARQAGDQHDNGRRRAGSWRA